MRAGREASSDSADALRVERLAGEAIAPHATDLVERWLNEGAPPESIAVLCRVNSGLLPVQVLAHDRGLPVTAAVGETFLRRTGVRSALDVSPARVRGADGAPLSGSELAEIARRPNRRITAKLIDAIRKRRRWTLSIVAGAGRRARQRRHRPRAPVRRRPRGPRRAGRVGRRGRVCCARSATTSGSARRSGTLDNSGRGRDSSHLDDVTALLAIAAVHPDPATFEVWLREHLQGVTVGDDPQAAGQVTLSTVHRVKGLEWERVIVLGAHDGLMPHRLTDDIEEERRVFHVALTRCRTQVVLLADAAAPTPFIEELTTEPAPHPRARASRAETRLERSRRTAPAGTFTGPPAERSPLVDALRAWRLERSRADGVPAYVVLHDSTINEIAAAKPASTRELSRITGIGPTKLERYGTDILEIVGAQ